MKFENPPFCLGILLTTIFFCIPLQAQDEDLLASAEDVNIVILEPNFTTARTNKSFEKKYHYLVARSYFKLLAEAQNSERKLKLELEGYMLQNKNVTPIVDVAFQMKFNLANKKYKAHSNMLSGLKSWNLFSDNRTGDMFYFMAENEDRIYQMYKKNLREDKMVGYLIYRLADLYHLEE